MANFISQQSGQTLAVAYELKFAYHCLRDVSFLLRRCVSPVLIAGFLSEMQVGSSERGRRGMGCPSLVQRGGSVISKAGKVDCLRQMAKDYCVTL